GITYHITGLSRDALALSVYYSADVHLDLFSRSCHRVFAKDDPSSRFGLEGHALSERDGLTQRRPILQSERARRLHFAGDEKDICARDVDYVSRFQSMILIELPFVERAEVNFDQLVIRGGSRVGIVSPRL